MYLRITVRRATTLPKALTLEGYSYFASSDVKCLRSLSAVSTKLNAGIRSALCLQGWVHRMYNIFWKLQAYSHHKRGGVQYHLTKNYVYIITNFSSTYTYTISQEYWRSAARILKRELLPYCREKWASGAMLSRVLTLCCLIVKSVEAY